MVGGVLQHRQQRFRFARNLHFPNYLARVIHNADAGLLDRNVQSSKMVHAALLLLMLEAVPTDLVFTISLKRSTQNLQLSTSSPADYPIYASDRDQIAASRQPTRWAMCGRLRVGKGFLHGCRIGRCGHVWTAPSWQGFSSRVQDWSVRPCVDGSELARVFFTGAGLVGAAMCSAFERGSRDRWP